MLGRALLVSLGVIVSALPATASLPHLLPFQGVLTNDQGGQLPPGTYDLTFRLYPTAQGGTPVWSETQQVLIGDTGAFNVMLGAVTPLQGLSFDTPYFMGISVNGGAELSPRVQLGSSPYTLNSLTVENAAVTTEKIAMAAVSNEKIAQRAVSNEKIAQQAVTTETLAQNAVVSDRVADEAGAAYQEDDLSNNLGVTPENLTQRTISIPAPGYVIAIGTAWVKHNYCGCLEGTGPYIIEVSLSTTSSTHDASNLRRTNLPCNLPWTTCNPPRIYEFETTVQDVFNLSTAGSKTIYFVASAPGDPGSPPAQSPEHNLLLLYVPTAYGTIDFTGNNDLTEEIGEK